MKVSESGYTREELLEIVDTYLAEQSRRWEFIEEKGDGMYVYAENGDRYLDFFAGIAVSSAGNANKKVAKAIADQAANVIHASNYAYTLPMILLAKKVCDTIGMEKIVFQNSGTEANEAMIKMARKYGVDNYGPDRYKIVTAKNSFHGRTYGALSATGQPDSACHKGFAPLLPGFTYAEYNNLEDFKSKCDENTIGIMVEPVQGEGGVHPATPEFMKGLREFCDEKGMLLLLDEVQTGWCRTGAVMSYMNYGVKPDIVSMAKGLVSNHKLWVSTLLMAVTPGIVEELAYRGVIMGSYRYGSRLAAIIIGGIMFGAMHMNFNQMAYAMVLGMMLGFLAEATGSIFTTMYAHFCFNEISVIISYIASHVSVLKQMVEKQASEGIAADQLKQTILIYIPFAFMGLCAAAAMIVLLAYLNGRHMDMLAMFRRNRNAEVKRPRIISVPLVLALCVCIGFMIITVFVL